MPPSWRRGSSKLLMGVTPSKVAYRKGGLMQGGWIKCSEIRSGDKKV